MSQWGSKTVNKANRNKIFFDKQSKRKMLNLFLSQFFVRLSLCMHASLNVLLNNKNAFIFLPSFYHSYTIVFLPFPSSVKVSSRFFSRSLLRTLLLPLCLGSHLVRLVYFGLIKHVSEPLLAHMGFDLLHRAAGLGLGSPTLSSLSLFVFLSFSLSLSLSLSLSSLLADSLLLCLPPPSALPHT